MEKLRSTERKRRYTLVDPDSTRAHKTPPMTVPQMCLALAQIAIKQGCVAKVKGGLNNSNRFVSGGHIYEVNTVLKDTFSRIKKCLATGNSPTARDAQMLEMVEEWGVPSPRELNTDEEKKANFEFATAYWLEHEARVAGYAPGGKRWYVPPRALYELPSNDESIPQKLRKWPLGNNWAQYRRWENQLGRSGYVAAGANRSHLCATWLQEVGWVLSIKFGIITSQRNVFGN